MSILLRFHQSGTIDGPFAMLVVKTAIFDDRLEIWSRDILFRSKLHEDYKTLWFE